MAIDIVMPNLGFDTKQARIVEWKTSVGEFVQKGQVIAIVESDKAAVELESIASGLMLEQRCAAGETAAVGDVIARVGKAEEGGSTQPSAAALGPGEQSTGEASVSPVARRLAEEFGLDLGEIRGSGPGGRIMRTDVEARMRAAPPPQVFERQRVPRALPKVRKAAREAKINLSDITATGARGTITMADLRAALVPPPTDSAENVAAVRREIPISRMRLAIGKRLGESKRAAPHFYVSGEFDLDAALRSLPARPAPSPRVNDLIQFLTVQTLRRVPALNAVYENERLYQYAEINLSLAVALDEGLITPVLRRAERLSLSEMTAASQALIQRARENRLTATEVQEATFTISNLGMTRQVDQFTAVINPPQVAILAVGAVKPRPVVVDGGLFVRQTVHLTLSGDHRFVDGTHLAAFLRVFQEELDAFVKGSNS